MLPCNCRKGFSGKFCQDKLPNSKGICAIVTCFNGGMCVYKVCSILSSVIYKIIYIYNYLTCLSLYISIYNYLFKSFPYPSPVPPLSLPFTYPLPTLSLPCPPFLPSPSLLTPLSLPSSSLLSHLSSPSIPSLPSPSHLPPFSLHSTLTASPRQPLQTHDPRNYQCVCQSMFAGNLCQFDKQLWTAMCRNVHCFNKGYCEPVLLDKG